VTDFTQHSTLCPRLGAGSASLFRRSPTAGLQTRLPARPPPPHGTGAVVIYEGLIGYSVLRLDGAPVCLESERVWVTVAACKETPRTLRAAWLQETAGVAKRRGTQLAGELESARGQEAMLEVLGTERMKGMAPRKAGEYVLQPGPERRRTSSHYTPKSLTSPIVAKALEPILHAIGQAPIPSSYWHSRSAIPPWGRVR
jgi:hypothetical protein